MAIFPQAVDNAIGTAMGFAVPGLTALKSLLTKPLIGGVVPLDLESIELTAEAQVATQLLVDIDGDRKIVNDNIAPGPRTWTIRGSIFPYDAGISQGLTSIASGFTQMIGQGSFGVNQMIANILWDIFENRKKTTWRDADGKIWNNVAIERLSITNDPGVQNRILMSATIKEIRIQSNINAIISSLPSGASNRSAEPFSSGVTSSSKLSAGDSSLRLPY
jgi:hypothetical protein